MNPPRSTLRQFLMLLLVALTANACSRSYYINSRPSPKFVMKHVEVGEEATFTTGQYPASQQMNFVVAEKDDEGFSSAEGRKILYTDVSSMVTQGSKMGQLGSTLFFVVTYPFVMLCIIVGVCDMK